MEEYIGIIRLFAGGFVPRGWLLCDGKEYSVGQYAALFAVCAYKYGGNGGSTFAVPNLCSRIPVGMGQGPGLSSYALGQSGGAETATLSAVNLPQHDHIINGSVDLLVNSQPANTQMPVGNYFATASQDAYYIDVDVQGERSSDLVADLSLTTVGSAAPFDIVPPYLGMNYIICAQGYFPPPPPNQ